MFAAHLSDLDSGCTRRHEQDCPSNDDLSLKELKMPETNRANLVGHNDVPRTIRHGPSPGKVPGPILIN